MHAVVCVCVSVRALACMPMTAVVAHAAHTYLGVGAGVGVEVGARVGGGVGSAVGEVVGLHIRSAACWPPTHGMACTPCHTVARRVEG